MYWVANTAIPEHLLHFSSCFFYFCKAGKFFFPRNSSWYAMSHAEEEKRSLHCIDMISYHPSVVCWLVAHINYFFFSLFVVNGRWCTVIGWLGFVVWYDWQKTTRLGAGRLVQEAFYYSWILPGVYYEPHRPSEGQGKLDTNSHGSGNLGVVWCGVIWCVLMWCDVIWWDVMWCVCVWVCV